MNIIGERLHFTFFISGTNFIADSDKASYQGPQQKRGMSRINFGGSSDDLRNRVGVINELRRSGHEIASHAVGHFDGRRWSATEWAGEFDSFDKAFRHVVGGGEIVGFRAPYLATSAGLYSVLRERGFRYDTSGDALADAWP